MKEHYRALIQLRRRVPTLQTGELIMLKSNKPSVYTAVRADKDGIFLILTNLSNQAIEDYNIPLDKAGLAGSAYHVSAVFGAEQVDAPEVTQDLLQKYKPFAALPPYAMIVLKFDPK